MESGAQKWASYYSKEENKNNFYPENFVTRIFLSKSPVKFLDFEYEGKSILDLGCGHGRNIPFLVKNGFNVTGLEVSLEQVNKLESNFPEQNFLVGTADSLPCQSSSFDYVLACNSIYYLTDDSISFVTHLAEVKRVLKSNGKFVFSMLGTEHSIFNGVQPNEYAVFKIEQDFLGFRQGVKIQAYDSTLKEQLFDGFVIEHHGEVIERVNSNCRHLHYFVASKS